MRLMILALIPFFPLSAQQVTVGTSDGAPAPVQAAESKSETRPEDRCSLEGQVLNSATGEPISKANLTLRRSDIAPGPGGAPPTYITVTDSTGSFVLKDLEPGKYRLSANR